jgi:hypothetical protein
VSGHAARVPATGRFVQVKGGWVGGNGDEKSGHYRPVSLPLGGRGGNQALSGLEQLEKHPDAQRKR